MKSIERFSKFETLHSVLGRSPVKGSAVREGHAALEAATEAVRRAELAYLVAKERSSEASARARDASRTCVLECRKARGILVSKEADFAPRSLPTSGFATGVLRRAELILARGDSIGVKFAALAVAKDELLAAVVEKSAARVGRASASREQDDARAAWDGAHGLLRAVIEAELRRSGLTGAKLDGRLAVYFPPSRRRRAASVPDVAPPVN